MHTASKLLVAVLFATMMLQVGLSLPRGALRDEVRRVSRLLRGLVLFLVLAPLTAALVAWVFRVDRPTTVALVLLATAGVVPLAPRFARAARGDVAFALVLTFTLGALTTVTSPSTARWLLGYSGTLAFHPRSLIPQLALLQWAPLLLGLLISRSTSRAPSIERVVGWVNTAVLVVVVLVIVVPHIKVITAPGWRGEAAAVTLSVVLALAGYVVGGPGTAGGRTLAALVNGPNVSLALAVIAGVGAPPVFGVTVVGVFLLRTIVGLVVQKVLAHAADRAHVGPAAGATRA